MDRERSSLQPIRTYAAFAEELALALAMVLPLASDRSALFDELEAVPLAGKWIQALLSPTGPARVARAVDGIEQQLSSLETPREPHAWCEQVLQTGDEQRRRSHGFYLTPDPLARFVVRGVDQAVRTWCGLPGGLAEECSWRSAVDGGAAACVPPGVDPEQPFVSVLDPAAGTGVFLAEVLRSIHGQQLRSWEYQAVADPLRNERWNAFAKGLIPRLQGIEIMIGPYAVAHLHLRRVLRETGYRLPPDCVFPVYLADALARPEDGPTSPHATEAWRARSAGGVTVVVGNPPFSGIAPPAGSWMQELMADYKVSVRAEERQIQRLSNSYVRFLRLVQWMAGRSGVLIAGLVTDRGWGEGVLFRDVRRSWLSQASAMRWIDLGGAEAGRESRGEADEGLFAIRQPTAVAIARLQGATGSDATSVDCCSVRGSVREKVEWMQQGFRAQSAESRAQVPQSPQYRFAPVLVLDDYAAWPSLLQWAGTGDPALDRDHRYGTGVKTRHDGFVVGMTPSEAVDRVRRVAWRTEDDGSLIEQLGLCTTGHFDLKRARKTAEQAPEVLAQLVHPLWFRPFDARFVVYDRAFVCEPKVRLMKQLLRPQNASLAVLRQDRTGRAAGYLASRGLVAKDMVSSRDDALIWPLYVQGEAGRVANLSAPMLEALCACTGLKLCEHDESGGFSAWDVMGYIYAILWSPSYRSRHTLALCRDFPRVPLPSGARPFRALAALGAQLCRLHLDPEPTVPEGNASPGCRIDLVRWDRDRARVWLSPREWLSVPEAVWDLFVGNHEVCRGWLQARAGRTLDQHELSWFGGMVRLLAETLRSGRAIDAAIEEHGGWSGAFRR